MRYPRFGHRRIQVFLGRRGLAMGATGRTASGSTRGCRCPGDGQAIPRMREPAPKRKVITSGRLHAGGEVFSEAEGTFVVPKSTAWSGR